jgi:predicted Zn finger-like uncharacterized protein
MIVPCPNCKSKFELDPDQIKEEGSKVRCSRCRHVFVVHKPDRAPSPDSTTTDTAPEPPAQPQKPQIETPPKPPKPAQEEAPPEESWEDDLDLGEPEAGGEADDEDLDFGGLDDDLDLGEPETEAGGEAADEDLDFGGLDDDDLDLGEPETETGGEADDEDLDFGGLDDDLDLGEPEAETGGEAADEDLDFGGLDDDDLDLGEPEAEQGIGEPDDEDLDFGDLDDDLGFGDDEQPEGAVAADEDYGGMDDLGLADDLGLGESEESDLGETVRQPEEEGDEDLDFIDEGPELEDDEEIEEDDYGLGPGLDEEETEEADDEALYDLDRSMRPRGAEKPKKGRGCLWVVVILLFLAAAAGGVYYFAPSILTPILEPLGLGGAAEPVRADDPQGNKYISPENATHFFRQNEIEGQLLVITGQARNGYNQPRNYIKLKGILSNHQGETLAEETVYAGNVLSTQDLSTLPMNEILQRLGVPAGQDQSNLEIPPGASVKFMIVFNNIPNDLAEYTVEAVSSEPVRQ